VVVTKADGNLAAAARHAAADLRHALELLRPRHEEVPPEVLTASSPTGDGIAEVWAALVSAHSALRASGGLDRQRSEQARSWLWREVRGALEGRLRTHPAVVAVLAEVEDEVTAGRVTPSAGAARLLESFSGEGADG